MYGTALLASQGVRGGRAGFLSPGHEKNAPSPKVECSAPTLSTVGIGPNDIEAEEIWLGVNPSLLIVPV